MLGFQTSSGGRQAGIAQGLIIALAGFFPVMAILSLQPAVPSLLAHFSSTPHADIFVPVMVVTAPGLMIALLSFCAGWIGDRFGRRLPMLLATFFYGLLGAAPYFISGLATIFAMRLLLGVAEAIILTLTNVLLADYFDEESRRVWLTVQAVIGPILGTTTIMGAGLLTSFAWNGAFLIYLSAFPIFLAMLLFLYEPAVVESHQHTVAVSARFPWRLASLYVPITIAASILYYAFIVQSGLAFADVGLTDPARLGVILAGASLGVPVGGLLFGFCSKRLEMLQVIAIVFLIFAVGLTSIGLSHTLPEMIAASFVQQIGAGMCVASLIFWVSNLLPASHRGRGFGFWTSAFFIGQFMSPAIFGPMRQILESTLQAFVAMGAFALIVSIACFIKSRRHPGGSDTASTAAAIG